MINIDDLICYVAAYTDEPERTKKLEQEIQIGTGFHGKWYRSQREHLLGWLVFQQCEARRKGIEPEKNLARPMWNRLKCSPLMFWLAESSGVGDELLSKARDAAIEATAINPKDGNPHGKMIREILPWEVVEQSILTGPRPLSSDQAGIAAGDAFDRLTQLRPEFKKARVYLASEQ